MNNGRSRKDLPSLEGIGVVTTSAVIGVVGTMEGHLVGAHGLAFNEPAFRGRVGINLASGRALGHLISVFVQVMRGSGRPSLIRSAS